MKFTISLVVINVVIFILMFFVFDPNEIVKNYGFSANSFFEGKVYTLITSLFLHADFSHIIFNMIALFFLGTTIEKNVELKKYVIVYFLGGILGNFVMLIPFLYSPEAIGIGASGAISALVGLGTFLCPGKFVIFPSILPLPFVVAGVVYFLSTAMNLFVPSQIGYPVHMIGILVGSILGLKWSDDWRKGILIFIVTLILIILLPFILEVIFA